MNSNKEAINGEIPEELQTEILSWLPGKSLSRFNCVCKLWGHSFTSNAFLLRHSRSPIPTNLFFCFKYLIQSLPYTDLPTTTAVTNHHNDGGSGGGDYDDDYYSDPDNEYDDNYFSSYYFNYSNRDPVTKGIRVPLTNLPPSFISPGSVAVTNFCDGLICLFTGQNYLPNLSILLYSVRVNDFILLPAKSESGYSYIGRLFLCSLGFDPINKQYKVLRAINGENSTIDYEILTIGSKFWRKPVDDCVIPLSLLQVLPHEGSFCLNGVIYWVNEVVDEASKIVIGSFDLTREKFRAFEVDKVVEGSYNFEKQYYLTAVCSAGRV